MRRSQNAKMSWLAVIIAACISLVGIIINSTISSISDTKRLNQIIYSTQIKEFYNETQNAHEKMTTTAIPDSNINVLVTQTTTFDWNNLIDINIDNFTTCSSMKIPYTLIGKSNSETYKAFFNTCVDSSYGYPQIICDMERLPGGVIKSDETIIKLENSIISSRIGVELTNINDEKRWIKIGNKWNVIISYYGDTELKNVYYISIVGCGGGNDYKVSNTEILLTDNYTTYSKQIEFLDFDYYTLEQGEFETFIFTPECNSQGYYYLSVEIPIEYDENHINYLATYDKRIICAENYHWIGEIAY